ncbi:hypothetical protein [Laspinema sp. D2d]|nr:hypothetical protein [Laspinema sp. D2d]
MRKRIRAWMRSPVEKTPPGGDRYLSNCQTRHFGNSDLDVIARHR